MAGLMGNTNLSARSRDPRSKLCQYLMVSFFDLILLVFIIVGYDVGDLVEIDPVAIIQDDYAIGVCVNVAVTHFSSVLATLGADLDLCDGCGAGLV